LQTARGSVFQKLFPVGDLDNNQTMTEQELRTLYENERKACHGIISLTVAEKGMNLLEIMDVNRDRRLTQREMRTVCDRFSKANSRKSLSTDYLLTACRAAAVMLESSSGNKERGKPIPLASSVPVWFRKMDRNGDGDVSRREWLGSTEDLKRLDLDGDGVIDPEEAEKAK
jgi:hypothetical protein